MTTENNENELMTEEATNTEEIAVQTTGEENTESGGTDAGTETGGSSGTDAGTNEELPLADQKKAINLQDLIYVKKYINDQVKAFKNKLISDLTNGTVTVKKATNASTASDAAYAISAGRATKDSDGNVIKDTYYKKTDTVASAEKATKDGDGNVISETYRKKTDTVANATNADKATYFVGSTWVEVTAIGYGISNLVNGATYQILVTEIEQDESEPDVDIITGLYTHLMINGTVCNHTPLAHMGYNNDPYKRYTVDEILLGGTAHPTGARNLCVYKHYANSSGNNIAEPVAYKIRRIS